MLRHFVAVYLTLLPFAQCIQIHEHMTEEEVLGTFQTGRNNVPEYEVVRLYHTLHKRDISGDSTRMVKLNALGRDLSLYLKPTKGLLVGESTPVWTVVEHFGWPDGIKYARQRNILEKIGQTYQDVSKMSAIVAYEGKDGETLLQGNLLEDLSINPVPYRLRNTILRERRDLVDLLPDGVDGDTIFQRSHYHVVFKTPERDMNATSDSIRVVERQRRSLESVVDDKSKESIPDIIYPEVLIIVDFNLYKAIGKNLEETVRYILAYWNAVDLRYRLLEEPVIRLNIAGIIISLQQRGTPYLENYRRDWTKVIAELAADEMSRYFYTESYRFPFDSYDFAVAMTSLDMCTMQPDGFCEPSTAGYAFRPGACNINHIQMVTKAVAMVEDNGGFKGVLPTVHEIAHLMGVPHDQHEDSKDCPAVDGYIMSPTIMFNENAFQWSKCSLEHLYAFLSGPHSTCLRNEPRTDKPLSRLMPGQLMTIDEQCEKIGGTKACYYDSRVCTSLACFEPGNDSLCGIISAAAEGSPCGDELHCINGYCVNKNVKDVPFAVTP